MRSEFQAAIAQLIAEKGLPREVVMETVATALLAAYRKSFGGGENIRIEVDKNGEVHVWAMKRVVAQVSDPNEEISLAEAQLLVPRAALGQSIDVDSSSIFNRIPTQTAKQVILQRIREAEHEHLYDQIKNWMGEIRLGTLTRKDPVRGWLLDFEVPEIYEGTVEIKAIAREPGSRSKVAVVARQEGLDPIGSCVGVRGSRINNIVHELNDEKIDIIQWSADPATFVANSLSPVKPLRVELRESDHTAVVTVPERQLSLAIGKDGQNARLAAKLTGWRVDVTKPVEGEVFEDRPDQFQEPVASQSSRRDRGDRSQGRHDRYDRGGEGGGGSRRSGHYRDRGSHRHNSSYGYDTDRE